MLATLRRGFPYGFSRGIPCSAYTAKYPIPGRTPPAPCLLTQSERNVPNAPENIARMKREKIVTYYSVLNSGMNRLMIGDSERYQFPQRHICIDRKSTR